MLFQTPKTLIVLSMAGLLYLAPAHLFGQAQPPTSQEPQKNWKDRAEYDLYNAILTDNNPQTKLEKLQQWQTQYPTTDWNKERRTLFLTTYANLGKAKEAVDVAKRVLADNPNDFTAQYYTMYFTQALYAQNQAAEILDQGARSATAILANINTPPPNVTAEQWAKLKPDVELLAHTTLGFVHMQKKEWDAAEAEFQKVLQTNPNNGEVDHWMGTVIAGQGKPERQSEALFYFARAAAYEGPGALSPDFRKTDATYVERQYKRYHGSGDGFDKLMALAKTTATPPPNFHIASSDDLAAQAAKTEAEWENSHPEEAMWKKIKAALTAPDGENYFNSGMKDAQLPPLKGKVVKLEPAVRPRTVVLAMEDGTNPGTTPDATLKLDTPLPGKVEPGTELSFQGIPESYTANPFMVVFNVAKDKLQGWTGKNAPATPAHRRAKGRATAKK